MILVPLTQPDSPAVPEDVDPKKVTSFQVTIQIDEKTFKKQEKADSIQRWVKYMVLEVALELLGKLEFDLENPEQDTFILMVDSFSADRSFRSFALEFVNLLRESTKYLAEDRSVLHFLSVVFLPNETV